MSNDNDQAWFINEDGGVYQHDRATQREDFPHDDHRPYLSERSAQQASDRRSAARGPARTLTIDVTVEAPSSWSDEDLMDVVRFHLNLNELTDAEVDVSAAEITNVQRSR